MFKQEALDSASALFVEVTHNRGCAILLNHLLFYRNVIRRW